MFAEDPSSDSFGDVCFEDLWLLCKNNPHLASLKLTYCVQLTNNGVRAALNMLNRLESLDIEGIKNSGTGFFLDNSSPNTELFSSINFKSLKRWAHRLP